MIYVLISYLTTTLIFFVVRIKLKTKHTEIKNLKINCNGVCFFSYSRHRICVGNSKIMQVGNIVYVKQDKKVISVKNVDDLYLKNEYLYFTSNGKCEINFPCVRLSKYFNIRITSHMFNVESVRQKALKSIPENIFDLSRCKEIKTYLNIIKNILKISVSKNSVSVLQNQFKMPFTLEYVSNNTKKIIHIN